MISKRIQEKGILAKLLEKGIKLIVQKECQNIGKVKINIIASSIQIIRGIIPKIHIIAKEINYKNLLFDEVKLEANDVKIIFNISNKKYKLKNNSTIKVKISLSENSLKNVLLSNNWEWIRDIISKGILNHGKLKDVKIIDGQILMKTLKDDNIKIVEKIDLKAEECKLYLVNKTHDQSIMIPIEDKVCIKDVNIESNLINIFLSSSISF